MRVVKEAAERKNEILDVAEKLFCTKGFDQTSTNDILKEIGIARGTLYYHFKSKEEILDAMIERILDTIIQRAAVIANDETRSVYERLTNTIRALNVENDTGLMIMEEVHRPQNALMHQKMQEQMLARVNPLITKIIKDGMKQGIWDSNYPEETVEMILLYSNTVFDSLRIYTKEERERKISAFIYNTERLLHMSEGNLLETILPMFASNEKK